MKTLLNGMRLIVLLLPFLLATTCHGQSIAGWGLELDVKKLHQEKANQYVWVKYPVSAEERPELSGKLEVIDIQSRVEGDQIIFNFHTGEFILEIINHQKI